MLLNEVIKHLESPEKVLAVPLQEELIDWTTFFIHQLEQEIADLDFKVDTRMAELAEKNSVARSEVLIKLDLTYIERKKKALTLKSLKSYRTNIRKKRDRMTNNY